jgi:radical SAM protein with 4Fe4S-binding SPASM domain
MNSFSKSKNKQNALEITVRVGCGRMCDYCPQELFIQSYKTKSPGESRTLSLENLQSYMSNVPSNTLIKWTGFTEPLDAKEFPEMVEFLDSAGFEQTISTTLCGNERALDFFLSRFNLFSQITLHLPDDQGLMKGRFDEEYTNTLKTLIVKYTSLMVKPKIDFFLIGNNWHDSVREVVEESVKNEIFTPNDVIKAKYLNTRASAIQVESFGLKVTKRLLDPNKKYYCSYQRLNQGVLLPNGNVVLCCQDYGMDHTIGSLEKTNLLDLYMSIEENPSTRKSFENGNFEPCNRCEHYQPIDAPTTTARID